MSMFDKPIQQALLTLTLLAALVVTPGCNSLPPSSSNVVQVFILAGQSNMEGQGVVDMDHPRYYNGGKGILNRVMADPKRWLG